MPKHPEMTPGLVPEILCQKEKSAPSGGQPKGALGPRRAGYRSLAESHEAQAHGACGGPTSRTWPASKAGGGRGVLTFLTAGSGGREALSDHACYVVAASPP